MLTPNLGVTTGLFTKVFAFLENVDYKVQIQVYSRSIHLPAIGCRFVTAGLFT